MADTKISALPASTTPLAGTEVLPIVQGGATKQVSVANLTAGRVTALGNNSTVGTSSVFPFITANGARVGNDANSPTRVTVGNQDTGASAVSGIGFESAGGGWQLDVPPDVVTFTNPLIGKFNGTEVFRFKSSGSFAPVNGAGIDFSATSNPAGMTSELLADYEEGTWTPAPNSGTFSSAAGQYTRVGRVVTLQFNVTVGTGGGTTMTGNPFTTYGGANAVAVSNAMYTEGQTYPVGATTAQVLLGGGGSTISFVGVGTTIGFTAMTLTASAVLIGSLTFIV